MRHCLLAVLFSACFAKLDVSPQSQIQCASDAECPKSFLCRVGRCVSAQTLGDATLPGLEGEVSIVPSLGRAGATFSVAFQVHGELAQAPSVTLDARSMSRALTRDDMRSSNGLEIFQYTALGDEPEGSARLFVDLVDTQGNAARGLLLGTLAFDFTHPRVAAASLIYEARADSALAAPTAAAASARIVLTVSADETLSASPAPMLIAATPTSSFPFVLEAQDGARAVFAASVPPSATDGAYALQLVWSDVAGNASVLDVLPEQPVNVRTSTPLLTIDQSALSYWRSPWGAAEDECLSQDLPCSGQTVPAGPLYAVAPSDPLSDAKSLPAHAFTLADRRLARVRFWASADRALLLGVSAPNSDGTWPRQRLSPVDTPTLFVSGVDDAGNESAAVAVAVTEWVATATPPSFGQSPHAAVAATAATAARDADPNAAVPSEGEIPSSGVWHERPVLSPLDSRAQHAIAYDSARGKLVLFGGSTGVARNDVWERDSMSGVWVGPFSPAKRPSARVDHAIVYDRGRGRVILFGGTDASGLCDDVWEWDGETWFGPFRPTPRPSPRDAHVLSYDLLRERTVLFGGNIGPSESSQETWEWNAHTHTWEGPLSSPDMPSKRVNATMSYDMRTQRSVLFGGVSSGAALDDVWEWDGEAWSGPFLPASRPSARRDATLSYDSLRMRSVLVGGEAGSVFRDDAWEWDDETRTWSGPNSPSIRPGARSAHGADYDSVRGVTVVFGGFNPSRWNDTWEWNGESWGLFAPSARPAATSRTAAVYDSLRGRAVLFGGTSDTSFFSNEVWSLDGRTSTWAGPFAPTGRPVARADHGLAYDSNHDQVVLFGGNTRSAGKQDEVWLWSSGDGTWTGPLTPALRPEKRGGVALAYDIGRDRTVLFGGSGTALLDDVWEWNGATWEGPFTPSPRPSARSAYAMAYDAARARVVLFGGETASANSDEVWEWDGALWYGPLTPVHRPSARRGHAMSYDASRGGVIVSGGDADTGTDHQRLDDVWLWDGEAWSGPLSPPLRPSPRAGHASAFDPLRGRLIVFGGNDAANRNDLWEWELGSRAVQLSASYGTAGFALPQVQALTFRTRCPSGALVQAWARGAWETLGAAEVFHIEEAPTRFLLDAPKRVTLRCVMQGKTALTMRHAEIRIRYRAEESAEEQSR